MSVVLEAGGVRVARDVEPEPAVALAVVWRGEQTVDEMFPRAGRTIGDEGVDLRRRRGQPEQIEIGAANQRVAVGSRRRCHIVPAARRLQEPVDRVGESRVAHVGKGACTGNLNAQ